MYAQLRSPKGNLNPLMPAVFQISRLIKPTVLKLALHDTQYNHTVFIILLVEMWKERRVYSRPLYLIVSLRRHLTFVVIG